MFEPAHVRACYRIRKTLLAIVLLATAALSVLSDAAQSAESPPPLKTLRVAITLPNNIKMFDPNRSFLSTFDIIFNPLFDKLMMVDRHGKRKLLVAKTLAFSEDGMSINVALNDQSYWSYGERVVAGDYVRGLQRAAMANSDTLHLMCGIKNSKKWAAGDYAEPLGVVAPDDNTLVIRLEEPFGYDLANLMNIQANPYPPPGHDSATHLASNGPYMLHTLEDGQISIVRNPHYRGALPYFDRIDFSGFSHNLAADAFISGNADMLLGPLGKQKKWLLDHYKSGALEIGLPRKYIIALSAPNADTPAVLRDPEFRRALYTSLDREAFEQSGTFFTSEHRCGFIPAAIPCSEERKRIWDAAGSMSERVRKAKDIVKRAGYDKDHPLKLSLIVTPSIYGYVEIANFVKSSWHEIGIDVEFVDIPKYADALTALKTGKYNLLINSYYQLEPHQYIYRPEVINAWAINYGPRNDYVDQLVLRASRSTGAEYEALILDAERYMMEAMTAIPIASDTQVGLYAEWLSPNQDQVVKLNLREVAPRAPSGATDASHAR